MTSCPLKDGHVDARLCTLPHGLKAVSAFRQEETSGDDGNERKRCVISKVNESFSHSSSFTGCRASGSID